jgi:tyrosine-specific transport protein
MISTIKNKQFLYASSTLVGAMVGVGIFGIPFAFAKAGFWIGLLFLIGVAFITMILYWMYGEVILRTKKRHQLVGYAELYLGSTGKKMMFFASVLGLYGTLLAYIILAGEFLLNVFSPFLFISAGQLSAWFFIIFSILILTGLRKFAKIEFFLTILFSAIVLIIFGSGIGHVSFSNLGPINLSYWFIPYGVIIFAFSALSSIHMQREVLIGQERLLKKSILYSILFTAVLYFLFSFVVFGISGAMTTPDSISGLVDVLGSRIIFLASLFGVLAIGTSYLATGTALYETFYLDYGIKKGSAWFLAVIPPYVLFLGGLRNFIDVIGLVGSVGVGIVAVLLIMMFNKAKINGDRESEYKLDFPRWFLWFLVLLFAGGVLYELFIF